jgi:nucleoid-associated protein YgaU
MITAPTRTLQSITVAGGNLFQIAAQYLGDATQWNRIAQLNGLYDPMLTGIVTLKIPPVDPKVGNGGILGA